MEGKLADEEVLRHIPKDTRSRESNDEEALAEARHFEEVCRALKSYGRFAGEDIDRMERHLSNLHPDEKALLIQPIPERIGRLREAVELNQSFLSVLVAQAREVGGDLPGVDGECVEESRERVSANIYRVRSTLKQFAREWSSARQVEREQTFGPLLDGLRRWLPLERFESERGRRPWVLCPGSGLGRLPFEVVRNGYNAQGNEFSYFMLLGSYFILNHALETESITIQPYALQSTNRRDHEDHLEVVRIPDVESTEAAKSGGNFSMCAGDFAEVYATQIGAWDAVLTCFFMDTAQNIIRYIHTIATVIPTGGVWINFGPLLYHFADSVIEPSIELSYEEIKSIASKYFEFKEEKWQDAFYTSCPKSMMQTLYHCVFFVAIRNDKKSPQSIYDECKVTNRTAKDLPLGPEYDGM